MHRLFTPIVEPLLDAIQPTVVIETGAGAGRLTLRVLDRLRAGATLHAIDPAPEFDPDALASGHAASLAAHAARSLDVIGRLGPCDLALLDGDPNWYTVRQELGLLASVARRAGHDRPVVVVHHTDWPFGRRDGFFDLESVPPSARWPSTDAGLVPGVEQPDPDGLRLVPRVALSDGLPRSGVLTAIEDFLLEQSDRWRTIELPGLHGISVLVPPERIDRHGGLEPALDLISERPALLRQVSRVEREWVRAMIRTQQASAPVDAAMEPPPAEREPEPEPEPPREPEAIAEPVPDLRLRLSELELRLRLERQLHEASTKLEREKQELRAEAAEERVRATEERMQLLSSFEHEKHELANRLHEAAREERESSQRASVEANVRLEIATRELDDARRASEALRQANADLERRSAELDQRVRQAEALAVERADQVRIAGARAAHYQEQLESSRNEVAIADKRLAALEDVHTELIAQGRAAAEQLDRTTSTRRFRAARRIGRSIRRITFRSPAPPHPLEAARSALQRELTQAATPTDAEAGVGAAESVHQ